jgi:probable O-glycosylation ligase (exosortase A-associated)
VATVLGYFLSSETKKFPRQREAALLLLLWGLFGLSTLFAIYPESAVSDFFLISKIFLMAFLSMSLINTERRLHLLLRVISLGMGFYGLKAGIFVLMTGGRAAIQGPDDSYFMANNTIGMAVAMNVPLLFYLSKIESQLWLRWVMRGMLVLSYPAVAGSFARGDWLGLGVMTVLMAIKSKHKFLVLPIVGICIIVAVAWLPQIVSNELVGRYDKLVNYEEDASAQIRFGTWQFCTRVGIARPLLGGGLNLYSIETYDEYFPEFHKLWPGRVATCHNTWLQILAEHGLLAFLLWIALFAVSLCSLGQARAYGRGQGEMGWIIYYADMLQIALIGFAVMGFFVNFAYYEVYYQLVVAIIVIKELIRSRELQASSTSAVSGIHRPVYLAKAH